MNICATASRKLSKRRDKKPYVSPNLNLTMFIALCILLIIALFVSIYYVRNKSGASAPVPQGNTTRISGGGGSHDPAIPGQTSKTSHNPGSIPDQAGNGNAAMSSGRQG